jgi:FixJ family two-component response regulator
MEMALRPSLSGPDGHKIFMQSRRKVVAVVDDDPSMLRAMKDLLDAYGFATMVFRSAEEFLASDLATQVDCLLLDINLSGMSGIELQRQLKASHSTIPVIFMTALDDEVMHKQAAETGCITCLRKPFPPRQLIDAIESAAPRAAAVFPK